MTARRYIYALLGAAMLVMVGVAFGAATATAAPLVEIVIYDGVKLPATTIVACSEPDCIGYSIPESQWTWEVHEPTNYVGWSIANGNPKKRIYLLVDGKVATSARSGTLLKWSTNGLSTGPHVVQGMGYGMDGTTGLSSPLVICVNTSDPC